MCLRLSGTLCSAKQERYSRLPSLSHSRYPLELWSVFASEQIVHLNGSTLAQRMLMGTCGHVPGLTKEETFMRHALTFSATSASTRLFLLFALLALVLGGAPPTLAQTDGQVDLTLGSGIANTNQVNGSNTGNIANTNQVNGSSSGNTANTNQVNGSNTGNIANTNQVNGSSTGNIANTNQVNGSNTGNIANTNQVNGSSNDKIANTTNTKSLGLSSDRHGRDIAASRQ